MNQVIIILGVLILLLILLRHYHHPAYEAFESPSKNVVICKADWCGHCQKAAPEFDRLVAASPIKLKDGSTAVVKVLDADKDKPEIGKYKVRGFPTILVGNGNSMTEYPGERTHDGILSFLNGHA